ncbi:sarcosine oxidase subunit gamma [Chelativorans sp. Marseille-P2723]|uniref:sarcosine oxidase subunit gamma n=1 Tax=Chelativorans sp. Marseille-P2723 TaxID=2709133 RepID=UPI00156EFEFE|nr:sarcosine oxidase subunit gamma [Chelativorans sp. Marseille-P2723]
MDKAVIARREPFLPGRLVEYAGITIKPAGTANRISLRAPQTSLAMLSEKLGLDLPQRPKSSTTKGTRSALWLGPDEWLVIDEEVADLAGICSEVSVLHSAVDISHRHAAIIVSGSCAEDVLNAGCPQNLSLGSFPRGAVSRTIFGKAEIVLWRRQEHEFRVECWRSFADYVFGLLEAAARAPQ